MEFLNQYHGNPGFIVGAIILALALQTTLFVIGSSWARRSPWGLDDAVFQHLRAPTGLLTVLLACKLLEPGITLGITASNIFSRFWSLLLITAVTWLVIKCTVIVQEYIDRSYDISTADNLVARQVHTQIRAIRRFIVLISVMVGGALMLMTFPSVRTVGASLLASAGIAGLAIGMAARPMLQNLIAGLQLALAQPIRLDDVVVVEGEWGRIEEITTTFVVIRIWDERRLVVPLSYFIENPIQTWTRTSADILGTVYFYTDYTLPVAALRRELEKTVKNLKWWDGRVVALQVTNTSTAGLELRALASAADGPSAWELRCAIREKLINFLQRDYPQCLPRTRVAMEKPVPRQK